MEAFQYTKPFDFDLPEHATLGGRSFTGMRARVYWILELTRERAYRHRIGSAGELCPPGWVPRHLIVEPWSGGAQGDRRMRELRLEYGCDIEMMNFTTASGARSSTTLYRLVSSGSSFCRHTSAPNTPVIDPEPSAPHLSPDSKTPLSAIRFWTCDWRPQEASSPAGGPSTAVACGNPPIASLQPCGRVFDAVLRVDPDSDCALAPSARIALWILRGQLPQDELDEAYRCELRAAFHGGEIQAELPQSGDVLLWHEQTSWNPLPQLTYALSRLGAQHMGSLSSEAA